MKTKSPAWLFLLFTLGGFVSPARAAEVSAVNSLGDGTYSVTAKATHKFTRNTEKLKQEAIAAATQFCAKEGKQLKVLSAEQAKSQYLVGDFAQVTLTFKALGAGDPELAAIPGAMAVPAAAVPVVPPKPMTSDELSAELTKLDELRKKGLINDAEFQELKQKVISRF